MTRRDECERRLPRPSEYFGRTASVMTSFALLHLSDCDIALSYVCGHREWPMRCLGFD